MVKKILLALIVAIGGVVAYAATLPDDFRLERSATIAAPASKIFAYLDNLKKWQEFSPWAKLDMAAITTFEGPEAGVGAKMTWDSKVDMVGAGSMAITESKANELVRYDLEMTKPFAAKNTADFTLKVDGANTVVTWGMSAKRDLMFKVVGVVMNCEKTLGGQFDEGLATLKTIAEAKK